MLTSLGKWELRLQVEIMPKRSRRVPAPQKQQTLFDKHAEGQVVRAAGAAPRQALGISVQYTRFCFLLLRAGPGISVSFEVLDDVAVHGVDQVLLSQTKSVTSNPVSDRSIDFWKTLANWVQTAQSRLIDPAKAVFELYVTKEFTGPIVESFHDAKDLHAAKAAFVAAKKELWGQSPGFTKKATISADLAPYLATVFTAEEIVVPIIRAFQLTCSKSDPRHELEDELRKGPFDSCHVQNIADCLEGWVKSRIDSRLRKEVPAIIQWDEFHVEYVAFVRKLTERHFLASMASDPDDDIIQEHRTATFVRQLEFIDLDFDDCLAAIIDYHKSTQDRVDWADRGEVHATSFEVLDRELQLAWKHLKRQSDTELTNRSEVERGQNLNSRCMTHPCKVQGLVTEPHFIRGAFHRLADSSAGAKKPAIGWHPDYVEMLAKKPRRAKQ